MDKTKILIADDHKVVIEGIQSALQEHPEFEVVGGAVDGLQAVELTMSLEPDIVIMDISCPNLGRHTVCEHPFLVRQPDEIGRCHLLDELAKGSKSCCCVRQD